MLLAASRRRRSATRNFTSFTTASFCGIRSYSLAHAVRRRYTLEAGSETEAAEATRRGDGRATRLGFVVVGTVTPKETTGGPVLFSRLAASASRHHATRAVRADRRALQRRLLGSQGEGGHMHDPQRTADPSGEDAAKASPAGGPMKKLALIWSRRQRQEAQDRPQPEHRRRSRAAVALAVATDRPRGETSLEPCSRCTPLPPRRRVRLADRGEQRRPGSGMTPEVQQLQPALAERRPAGRVPCAEQGRDGRTARPRRLHARHGRRGGAGDDDLRPQDRRAAAEQHLGQPTPLTTFIEPPSFPRIDMRSDTIASRGNHQPVWRYVLPDGSETRAGHHRHLHEPLRDADHRHEQPRCGPGLLVLRGSGTDRLRSTCSPARPR